jgi:hypothetical protein
MESVLVGLIGLGGLYTIANQQQSISEGFESKLQEMPNYPVPKEIDDDINQYSTPNQATDKYYTQQYYQDTNRPVDPNQKIKLMSDDQVDPSNFRHNNMVPFFGGKVKGVNLDSQSTSLMDSHIGTGTHSIEKQEQAPLFAPTKDVHWANGTPNTSDFIKSRQNPSLSLNNVTPFQQERVAPGLNLGYTTEGSNGFNSGMEARNEWLPKTVDELRTKSNPKLTFELNGLEGPAQSAVQNLGIEGSIEKRQPTTCFDNGPDRYFTTVGQEKGQTARTLYNNKEGNRATTSVSYEGIADGLVSAPMAPQTFDELSKNEHLYRESIGSVGSTATPVKKGDYSLDSYKIRPNNRVTTTQPNMYGGAGSLVNAITAPLLDMLRPTRKDNVIGNNRSSGNVQTHVGGEYVVNPGDVPKTTIKEMTVGKGNQLYVQGPSTGGYKVSEQQTYPNQRDTTNTCETNAGGATYGSKQQDMYIKNQRNNTRRDHMSYTPSGTNGTFNNNINMQISSDRGMAETTRTVQPSMPSSGPNMETYGKMSMPQYNDACMEGSDRLQPDLLTAFKNNPYTHSLHSYGR